MDKPRDLPRAELLQFATETIQACADRGMTVQVFFKFTCTHCGERCTFEEPNKLFATGECHHCGKTTIIEQGGLLLEDRTLPRVAEAHKRRLIEGGCVMGLLVQEWFFNSIAERDKMIDESFPKRECLDTPGCFRLPDGRTLAVFTGAVALYRPGKMVCPMCDSEAIYENNIVHVRLKVSSFNVDGEPQEFAYPWIEVNDTIRTATLEEDGVQRWYCNECGEEFDQLKEVA